MFVNEHSEEIDLPDPQILELHAAFSRVLHLTGAGEYPIGVTWMRIVSWLQMGVHILIFCSWRRNRLY